MHLKVSSARCRSFCSVFSLLHRRGQEISYFCIRKWPRETLITSLKYGLNKTIHIFVHWWFIPSLRNPKWSSQEEILKKSNMTTSFILCRRYIYDGQLIFWQINHLLKCLKTLGPFSVRDMYQIFIWHHLYRNNQSQNTKSLNKLLIPTNHPQRRQMVCTHVYYKSNL